MAVIPIISKILAMLLPITFPIAIPLLPFKLEVMLTISSGKEVPIETTVRPITKLDIFSLFAMEIAPSTRKSAPCISNKKPKAKMIRFTEQR